jgi:hypothetical protein
LTKEKLEQLISLKKEIRELENRLNRKSAGYPSQDTELLEERKSMVSDLIKEITEYINSVTDSRIRRIMQYRYVDGYTWYKISSCLLYTSPSPRDRLASSNPSSA